MKSPHLTAPHCFYDPHAGYSDLMWDNETPAEAIVNAHKPNGRASGTLDPELCVNVAIRINAEAAQ